MRPLCSVREPLQSRLRTIHHTTSVATAIRMLDSECIWSQDIGVPANFSLNQRPEDRLDESPEVSLRFSYQGLGTLVPFDFSVWSYESDNLYIHITEGLYNENLEGLKVWAARWPSGSSKNMTCVGFHLYRDYFESLDSSPGRQLLVQKLIEKFGAGVDFRVPSENEITAIRNKFPITEIGWSRAIWQRWFGKRPMPVSPVWPPPEKQGPNGTCSE